MDRHRNGSVPAVAPIPAGTTDVAAPPKDATGGTRHKDLGFIKPSAGITDANAASLPPLDRDRLRASVLIQHLRDARDLHYSRENRTILICFRSSVAAEWCWEALNGPAPRP